MSDAKAQQQQTFEESLETLEGIVARLEDGSLGLDESLSEFECGMKLLRQCHGLLEKAEQRIEVLTSVSREGEERTRPLEGQQTLPGVTPSQPATHTPESKSEPDESTLF